ncbi:MAG: 2-hydroxyhepta-2,4-diene-1,7-dioate isomerase [Luteitalea sp.]|nr:2-hydroxyhepta-2,4-diene-1,7-dioate isomerase [Luteitalea sp.]
MRVYRTLQGLIVESDGAFRSVPGGDWDALVNADDVAAFVSSATPCPPHAADELIAPIGTQEVWAAGVTYYRSRDARMEEAHDAGGGDFYARVYDAARPELFFKANAHHVIGPGGAVRIRRDAAWSVPEPELTLVLSSRGKIVGYTIGNDMSSRDIEGENPLYLPQAKVYNGSCAIGPCVLVASKPLPGDTSIVLEIERDGVETFRAATTVNQIRRPLDELVEYLYRELSFPTGCLLMTGTGIVPPSDFTLQRGDEIRITIEPIGTLINQVA